MPFASADEFYAQEPNLQMREFRESWQKFAIGTDQIDPACNTPSWSLAYHKVFNPANRVFYHLEDGGLLLFTEHMSDTGFYIGPIENNWMFARPALGFLAPQIFDYAIYKWQKEYKNHLPPILLSGMVENDITCVKFFLRHNKKFDFYRAKTMLECCASLEGGVDGWLSRRSGNHRAKLKKAVKKAKAYNLEFERHRPGSREEADRIFQRMLRIERQSWKGIEHCGMAEYPSCEFYNELIGRQSTRRDALVIIARLEGEDAGFIYGGLAGPYYRGQQFSYANDLGHLSLGNIMQWEKVKWLCEIGIKRYDMGPLTGARMGYKSHWTEIRKESNTWIMQRR